MDRVTDFLTRGSSIRPEFGPGRIPETRTSSRSQPNQPPNMWAARPRSSLLLVQKNRSAAEEQAGWPVACLKPKNAWPRRTRALAAGRRVGTVPQVLLPSLKTRTEPVLEIMSFPPPSFVAPIPIDPEHLRGLVGSFFLLSSVAGQSHEWAEAELRCRRRRHEMLLSPKNGR